jgi:hypothetical protein
MSLSFEVLNNFVLKFKPCVIASDVDLHGVTFSNKKENRWYFYQRFLN